MKVSVWIRLCTILLGRQVTNSSDSLGREGVNLDQDWEHRFLYTSGEY